MGYNSETWGVIVKYQSHCLFNMLALFFHGLCEFLKSSSFQFLNAELLGLSLDGREKCSRRQVQSF